MTKMITSSQNYILPQYYVRMIEDLDTARMATAMNVLRSSGGRYIDPDVPVKNIKNSYWQIIDSGVPRKATSL